MNANELMIGDYVTFKDCQYDSPVIIEIVALGFQYGGGGDCLVNIGHSEACDILELDDEIVGLPITPDILEENGFRYTEGDEELTHFYLGEPQFCKDMDLHIGTNNRGDFWLNTYDNNIHGLKYVHELQHALRLCGTTKEIIVKED